MGLKRRSCLLLRRRSRSVHDRHELDVRRIWIRKQNCMGDGFLWPQSLASGPRTLAGHRVPGNLKNRRSVHLPTQGSPFAGVLLAASFGFKRKEIRRPSESRASFPPRSQRLEEDSNHVGHQRFSKLGKQHEETVRKEQTFQVFGQWFWGVHYWRVLKLGALLRSAELKGEIGAVHEVQVRQSEGLRARSEALLEQEQTVNKTVRLHVKLGPGPVLEWVLYHWPWTQNHLQEVLKTGQFGQKENCQAQFREQLGLLNA